ncbi:MAG: glycoside hydrolase family 78 protein [Pirellulales bacterium]|nr:glycoside hydrolase family 78 protein [Pirellulales bacterium]
MARTATFGALVITVIFLRSPAGSAAPHEPPMLEQLRCEYQKNPLGIDTLEPRFSWVLAGGSRGAAQRAYQILVASSRANLDEGNADMWDSGQVASNQSTLVPYAGKPLASAAQYHWKLRIWDQSNVASSYSDSAWWEMGLLRPEDWTGQWIQPKGYDGVPGTTRTFSEEFTGTTLLPDPEAVAPNLFRKEFEIEKEIKRARAFVTGAGSYLFHINGKTIGDSVLAPDFTIYKKRIQYQAFDVTQELQQGKNALGYTIGHGVALRSHYPESGARQMLLQLNITYADGTSEWVVTDTSWKCIAGPRLIDNYMWGEIYDARRELPGWNKPEFDDGAWNPVEIKKDPYQGKIVSHQCEPIKVTETIKAVERTEPKNGVYVFDLGQNFAGWARLKVQGPAGTVVRLRFAEFLDEKGNVDFSNTIGYGNIQTDIYVLRGEGVEIWEPQFISHGFRYVEVTNYPGEPTLDAIEGRVVQSAVPRAGEFNCSNKLLNRIQKNITWGIRSNIQSIPTDCCQRAERSGWGGDAQVMADSCIYNFGMSRFYAKWLNDMQDNQREDGAIPDNIPYTGWGGHGHAGWHDVYTKIAMAVYEYYGDTRVIEEQYEGLKKSVQFILDRSQGYIWPNEGGYADWGSPVVDDQHKDMLATCNFYRAAHFMSKMAVALGKRDDAEYYTHLSSHIAGALNNKFFNANTASYASGGQAANAFALHLGIVPHGHAERVVESLVNDIKENDFHLTTGPQGTRYVMQALRMHGQSEVAYRLATQTTMPSWGYMVEKDATTVWEFWNGAKQISHNHPFLGSVSEWFFRAIAGIDRDAGSTGFEKIVIKPQPAGDLTWAKGSVRTIRGVVQSAWKKSENRFAMEVAIPGNSTARIYLPKNGPNNATVAEGGKPVWKDGAFQSGVAGITGVADNGDAIIVSVGSGVYSFEIR